MNAAVSLSLRNDTSGAKSLVLERGSAVRLADTGDGVANGVEGLETTVNLL